MALADREEVAVIGAAADSYSTSHRGERLMSIRSNANRMAGVALLAIAAACGGDAGDAPMIVGDPEPGGTAIVSVTSDFQPINPVTSPAAARVISFHDAARSSPR